MAQAYIVLSLGYSWGESPDMRKVEKRSLSKLKCPQNVIIKKWQRYRYTLFFWLRTKLSNPNRTLIRFWLKRKCFSSWRVKTQDLKNKSSTKVSQKSLSAKCRAEFWLKTSQTDLYIHINIVGKDKPGDQHTKCEVQRLQMKTISY